MAATLSRLWATLLLALAAGLGGLLPVALFPALATAQAPQWTVTSVSRPTNFAPSDQSATYRVTVTNTGGDSSVGPIAIVDELPAGLMLDAAGVSGVDTLSNSSAGFSCASLTCTYTGTVVPDETLALIIPIDVSAEPPPSCEVPAAAIGCVTNVVRVSGGGASVASMSTPTAVSEVPAKFGVSPGGAATALSTDHAGAHADLTTAIAFNTTDAAGTLAGNPRDIVDDFPPGFAADLSDTPVCPERRFAVAECPTDSQVGVGTLTVGFLGFTFTTIQPVYNLAPNAGQVAALGIALGSVFSVQWGVTLRRGDNGVRTTIANIGGDGVEADAVSLTIWGVPADPVHDPLRSAPGGELGAPSRAVPAPFFTNPTSCGPEPLRATFAVHSWQEPRHDVEAPMPFGPLDGCNRLSIEPRLEALASTDSTEAPSGLDVHLEIPQTYDNPGGLASSHLRTVQATLPEGMSLNPALGSGLGVCTLAEFEYESATADPEPGKGCPAGSKVGTVHARSPLLAEEASGSLYLAKPIQNPFGSLLALYAVARISERGVLVAIAGKVTADPLTGHLTASFEDLPQLPFSEIDVSLSQGQNSPLLTPPACGAYTAQALLEPWSAPGQERPASSGLEIARGAGGAPCPPGGALPFEPSLLAGSINPTAGAYSPFSLRLSRRDGDAQIAGFSVALPPGLLARLAGIPLCPDAAIAAAGSRTAAAEQAEPSCPPASRVGRTLIGAGVGTNLVWVPGRIYLAGPYAGAPFSLAILTPAEIGPFDLGTVVLREALRIDPETARLSLDSAGTALPRTLDGIALHLRDFRAYLDRPEFTLNPTSCEPMSITGAVAGSGGLAWASTPAPATFAVPFQLADCANLGFKPKLALRLSGATRRNGHPALRAVLSQRGGEANVSRAAIVLPSAELLDPGHIRAVCTGSEFAEERCPATSVYGYAKATTPLLSEPLRGPIYLRASGHRLPDLAAALHSGGVRFDLAGRIDSVHGRLRETFDAIPDVPFSKLVIETKGGRRGLLVNSTGLCAAPHRATADFTAHSGKLDDFEARLSGGCAK